MAGQKTLVGALKDNALETGCISPRHLPELVQQESRRQWGRVARELGFTAET